MNTEEPLSFTDWCCSVNIERQYELFHDEYGDAAAPLWEYKDYYYQCYLETFKAERDNTAATRGVS